MITLKLDEKANQRLLWFLQQDNYEELKKQYPAFYNEILEMQEILKANVHFLDQAALAFEIALNNMFIPYMDETTVTRLEEFLSIVPSEVQTLDDRKSVIAAHFKGYGKISRTEVQNISEQYNINAESFFNEQDSEGNYLLRIKLNIPNDTGKISKYVENINILDIRLPAHLKKFYDIVFTSLSDVSLVEISVNQLTFNHESDIRVSEFVKWFVDELGEMLVDENGNVLIDEEVV